MAYPLLHGLPRLALQQVGKSSAEHFKRQEHNGSVGHHTHQMGPEPPIQPPLPLFLGNQSNRLEKALVTRRRCLPHPRSHHLVRIRQRRRNCLGRPCCHQVLDCRELSWFPHPIFFLLLHPPLQLLVEEELDCTLGQPPVRRQESPVEPSDALGLEQIPHCRREVAALQLHPRLGHPQRASDCVAQPTRRHRRHHVSHRAVSHGRLKCRLGSTV
mmetsp:Transcript_10752/g.21535  ORF Transcript_10752/g.21535 Transcript_10752/m.21535 type:complete len:214 (-) Transcript_10752:207-848(-)